MTADQAAAAPPGTTVTVRIICFSTRPPAAIQLRRPATELARIADVVHGLALAAPKTRFRLDTAPACCFKRRATGMWGRWRPPFSARACRRNCCSAPTTGRSRERPSLPGGIRRRPAAARAGRQFQFFIINNRAVRSDRLRAALERPYRRLLLLHRYPVAVVRLEVDPHAVDVNVHPEQAGGSPGPGGRDCRRPPGAGVPAAGRRRPAPREAWAAPTGLWGPAARCR